MSGLEDAVYQLLQQLKLDHVEEVARNIKVNIIQQVLKKISQRSLNKVLDPILRYTVMLQLMNNHHLTLKKVSTRSTRRPRIQSRGPRPLMSTSMLPR